VAELVPLFAFLKVQDLYLGADEALLPKYCDSHLVLLFCIANIEDRSPELARRCQQSTQVL
jgi:hypothetical protein